jgi:Domain of unknown function (DUF4148)
MKSKLISASVFAVAGLLSMSSFADGGDFYPPPISGQNTSTLTRAEVKAELLQAQRTGYGINFTNDSSYPQLPIADAGPGKTRAEVKAELMAASPRAPQYEIEHKLSVCALKGRV